MADDFVMPNVDDWLQWGYERGLDDENDRPDYYPRDYKPRLANRTGGKEDY